MYITKRSLLAAAALACCFLTANIALADDHNNGKRVRAVNCTEADTSIQDAIDKVEHGRDTTIFIVGFCDESVSIVKDGITLSGNRDGDDTIDGGLTEVRVTGAQRVLIEYLELTGDGYGVLAQEGASVTVRHNDIHNNVADGVLANNQAFARVEFNSIAGNGRIEYFEAGIEALAGATIRSRGNYIADNAYAAIEVGNMAYFRSGLFVPGGGSLDPADRDTFVQKGCSVGELAGSCGDPETFAVDCYRNALCDFRNTDVTGGSSISGLSNWDVRTTTINGNVEASGGARLHLRGSVTGSGFVHCETEAFASASIPCFGFIPGGGGGLIPSPW